MQRCYLDDELMPITTNDHLKLHANRARLIVLSNSRLDLNDCSRAMSEYGPMKLELTSDGRAAFVDFACEHAPLLVSRCYMLREHIPARMIPMGVDALLPGCSMDNNLYLQHVPRSMPNSVIRQYFKLHRESAIYRTGPAGDASSRVLIQFHDKNAEEITPQKDVLRLFSVMGKYTVSKFYAIPRIDSLIECSRVYEVSSCEDCNIAKIRVMIDNAERISATGMPVPPITQAPATPPPAVTNYASSRVLDFPSILDPSERARWGISSEATVSTCPVAPPDPTQHPLAQVRSAEGVSVPAPFMQFVRGSPSKRADIERILLRAQDEKVIQYMEELAPLFAGTAENNFGNNDTSRSAYPPARSPVSPPSPTLKNQEFPKDSWKICRTWIVNRIGAVVREKGERWLEEVSSEPPVAAGAQFATGVSSPVPSAVRTEGGLRSDRRYVVNGMMFGKDESYASRPSARDAPMTSKVVPVVASKASVTARDAPVTARKTPVVSRVAPDSESEEERDTPTPNRIVWEGTWEPSFNGDDVIGDVSDVAMSVVDNHNDFGCRRPTREDAAEPERAMSSSGSGFGRSTREDTIIRESEHPVVNNGFGFGFGRSTGEYATFGDPSARQSANVFLTPTLPRLDEGQNPVISTSVIRVDEPTAVSVDRSRSGSAAAEALAPAQADTVAERGFGDARPQHTPPFPIPPLMSVSIDAPPNQQFTGFGGPRSHTDFGPTPASSLPQAVGFGFGREFGPVVNTPEPTGFGIAPSSPSLSPFPFPISDDGYAPQVVLKPLRRKEKKEEPIEPERYSTTPSLSSFIVSSTVSKEDEDRLREEKVDSDDVLTGQEDRKLWRSARVSKESDSVLYVLCRANSSSSIDTLDSDDLLPGQEDLKQWKSAPNVTFPRRSSSRSTVPESREKERYEDVAGDDSSKEGGEVRDDRSRLLTDESRAHYISSIDGRKTVQEEEADTVEVEQKEAVIPSPAAMVDQEEMRDRGSSEYFERLTREVATARDSAVGGGWNGPRLATLPGDLPWGRTWGRGIELMREETTVAATVSQGARDSPSPVSPPTQRRSVLGRVVPTFGAKLGKPQ